MVAYPRTRAALDALVQDDVVPGISYRLFDAHREISRVRGLAMTSPYKEALRPGMDYDLASLTKVVATVPVIAWLIQTGQLTMATPVGQYLPVAAPQVTVRDLLTHTSALEGYIPNRDALPASTLTRELRRRLTSGPNRERVIRYADVNFIYLGWLAEALLGAPVHSLAQELVFNPLGMINTTNQPDPANTVPTAFRDGQLLRGRVHDPKGSVLGVRCGSAGLFSTLDDLTIFCRALVMTNLNGLLQPTMVARIFSDQTAMAGDHLRGLGWKLFHSRGTDHHLVASHTGYTGTLLVVDKQDLQGLIVLTNRVHPTGQNDRFLDRRDQLIATYLNEKENFA